MYTMRFLCRQRLKNNMRILFIFLCLFSFLVFPAINTAADVPLAISNVVPYLVRIETIGGHEKVGSEFANEGSSTGVLLDKEGHVITGAFNFLHDPTSILLVFPDGTKKVAQKIATDRLQMLTLLKAHDFIVNGFGENEMPPLPMRSKESLRIGERCIAIGAVLNSTEPNVALGIISGKNRIWGTAIQTDAAIGPNNYGGLLIDADGKVLGIPVPLSMMSQNVAAGAEMYDAGVGMAIPWADVVALLPKLKEGKDLSPGSVGFAFKDNQIFIGEPVIAAIQPDSPASKAGLQVGDKIVRIDDVPILTALDVTKNLRLRYSDETMKIVFLRGEVEQTVTLTTTGARERESGSRKM